MWSHNKCTIYDCFFVDLSNVLILIEWIGGKGTHDPTINHVNISNPIQIITIGCVDIIVEMFGEHYDQQIKWVLIGSTKTKQHATFNIHNSQLAGRARKRKKN